MYFHRETSVIAVLLLSSVPFLPAQAATGPSGHWEGTIQSPKGELSIEVDLAKNSQGELAGTFSNPAQNTHGFPFSSVAVDGRSISMTLRGASGGAFAGVLSADGKSMSGDFTMATRQGDFAMPFSLSRKGDARIEAPTRSAAIGKELEGIWNGTLSVEGKQLRLVLKMLNQTDGISVGKLMSLDQGEVEIPLTKIAQKGSSLMLDVKVVSGSYSGELNAAGTDLVGTWTQGPFTAPLNFTRATASKAKQ